ncbi:hypothetical protein DFH11DRAFT_1873514 [Phellopilus nigrolimitatus]|nr:hypothetical protein DFH11DRAFT_1873514 [Phellopilus nigrolimitatus]
MSNPGNVAGGHKANLKNPNTSDQSKQRSAEVVDDLQSSGQYDDTFSSQKNEGNVLGGHKATLKNPNVSGDAKRHSEQVLEDNSAL